MCPYFIELDLRDRGHPHKLSLIFFVPVVHQQVFLVCLLELNDRRRDVSTIGHKPKSIRSKKMLDHITRCVFLHIFRFVDCLKNRFRKVNAFLIRDRHERFLILFYGIQRFRKRNDLIAHFSSKLGVMVTSDVLRGTLRGNSDRFRQSSHHYHHRRSQVHLYPLHLNRDPPCRLSSLK